MIRVMPLEGKWWGVFLVAKDNSNDRYLLTSPLDKKADAENFATEFRRIVGTWRLNE